MITCKIQKLTLPSKKLGDPRDSSLFNSPKTRRLVAYPWRLNAAFGNQPWTTGDRRSGSIDPTSRLPVNTLTTQPTKSTVSTPMGVIQWKDKRKSGKTRCSSGWTCKFQHSRRWSWKRNLNKKLCPHQTVKSSSHFFEWVSITLLETWERVYVPFFKMLLNTPLIGELLCFSIKKKLCYWKKIETNLK